MIPASVDQLLQSPSETTLAALLDDRAAVFWVDWREEDDAIVADCETVLHTGSLFAELTPTEADPGFEIHIGYIGKRTRVPLRGGPEDRHITLHTLNQALSPDYEIRVCVDSLGGDTLAFVPLSTADWSTLESTYGARVAKHFRKIEAKPNLFTDA